MPSYKKKSPFDKNNTCIDFTMMFVKVLNEDQLKKSICGGKSFQISLDTPVSFKDPIVDCIRLDPIPRYGLMEMFLWTVGSFYVFGKKVDSTWFLTVRFHFFKESMFCKLIS